VTLLILVLTGCHTAPRPEEKKVVTAQSPQGMSITLGGFVENHPEGGTLNGVCGTDDTRNVLNCDIHNGLLKWTVTEVTIGVTWSPYKDDDVSYYRETVSLEPLKTAQVSLRLGTQLPPDTFITLKNRAPITTKHWSWLIANAKGIPSGKE
jgi:hypothetical protein